MCAGAGDALSVGARSALADMRGPGVPFPPGLGGGAGAHLLAVLRTMYECAHAQLLCSYMYASFNTL